MDSVHVRQRLRPVRYAFIVKPDDRTSAVLAASLNAAIWGGVYNPIVPLLPIEQRQGVLRAFDPDALVNLTGAALPDDLVTQYRLAIVEQDDLVSVHWRTGRKLLSLGLSIYPLVSYIHSAEGPISADHSQALMVCPEDAPLWAEFCAFAYGSFNFIPPVDDNFTDLFQTGLQAKVIDLPDLTLPPSFETAVMPLDFTRYQLRSIQKTANASSHIAFIGDHTKVADLLQFWNLRATGRTVTFVPVANYKKFEAAVRHVAKEGRYPINQELDNDADVQKGPSVTDELFREVAEWICTLNLGRLSYRNWQPRFGQPPVEHYVGDIHVSELIAFETDELSILQDEQMTPVKIVQPPILEEFGHMAEGSASCAIELSMIGPSTHPEYTFVFPEGPMVDRVVSRSVIGMHGKARLGRRGLVLAQDFPSRSSIYIRPVKTKDVFSALFQQAKLDALPSHPGQYAEQIISKMGNLHFDCRVFKVRGIRQVFDKLGDGSTLSKGNIYQTVMSTIPDDFGVNWRPDLYDASIHGFNRNNPSGAFDFGSVFDILLEKQLLRAGLVFRCRRCYKEDWYHVSEFTEHYKCRYCFEKQRVDFASKNEWQFKADGLLQIRDGALGSLAVILSLWSFEHFSSVSKGKYWTSQNLTAQDTRREYEIDYAYLLIDQFETSYELVLGQATRFSDFTDEDMQKMSELADRFTVKPYLAFTTLKDRFSDADKTRFSSLVEAGYKVIAFTREDLDPYDLHNRFAAAPHRYGHDLRELSENTLALNVFN